MIHTRTAGLLAAALLSALLLAGCSSGGGEPSVSQSVHDLLQQELDTTLADLKAEQDAKAKEVEARMTAEAEVTRLTGELATATASVTSLTTLLGTASDSVTSLTSELSDAEAEVTRLTNQVGSVTEPTSLQGMLSAANSEVARLMSELTAANADVARLTTERNTARSEVTSLEGRLDTALDRVTEVQEDLDDAEDAADASQRQTAQLQGQLTEAEQANLRARADRFITVLGRDDAPAVGTATVYWGESLQFMPNASYVRGSAAPSVPGGWRSASFTGRAGTSMNLLNDTVYLYTNIQSPGGRAFWKVHGEDVTINEDLESLSRGSSAQPGPDTSTDMMGRQFSEIRISGSLNGTGGTFTCTDSTNCTCSNETCGTSTAIESQLEGRVTFSQGQPNFVDETEWVFEPSSHTASSYRLPQDDAYLYFGIWVSEPDVISGTPEFRYLAGGGGVTVGGTGLVTAINATPSRFNALTGTATFRGGAVGSYVTRDQVGQTNSRIGTFTATASFNVDFGADNVPGTLHGQITDFREGGTSLAGWGLTLGNTANVAQHERYRDARSGRGAHR